MSWYVRINLTAKIVFCSCPSIEQVEFVNGLETENISFGNGLETEKINSDNGLEISKITWASQNFELNIREKSQVTVKQDTLEKYLKPTNLESGHRNP